MLLNTEPSRSRNDFGSGRISIITAPKDKISIRILISYVVKHFLLVHRTIAQLTRLSLALRENIWERISGRQRTGMH